MKKERFFCKICNTQTNLTIDSFSRYHLKPEHSIGMKEYYDRCIKKEDEGICLHCGKKTKYYGYRRGYANFCCQKHQRISKYTSNKIKESFRHRDTKKELEKRKKTCIKKYGKENIFQVKEIKEKWRNTIKEKYGVDHNFLITPCKKKRERILKKNKNKINEKRKNFWRNLTDEELDQIMEKKKETYRERYGVDWISNVDWVNDKIRKTNEKNGKWIVNRSKNDFLNYKNEVRNETNRHKIKLFKKWNGNDYYTGEILDYNSHKLYPTIDHKISQHYGFINNIDPKEIGSFKNLCICSRKTNAMKNRLIENEFRIKNEYRNKI